MKTCRNKLINRVLVMVLVLTLSIVFNVPQNVSAARSISLRAGETVYVETTNTLNSDQLRVGDQVELRVIEDVLVDGEVVIKGGEIVSADIIRAQSSGIVGRAGELDLRINRVRAVDGTNISLSGSRRSQGNDKQTTSLVVGLLLCFPFLLMSGDEAEISANTRIHTTVAGTYEITID